MIKDFSDFCAELINAGFSIAGGNGEGVFALINFSWNNQPFGSPVRWHTGNPDTDPWEWRVRVLDERNDIAYAKMFFRKGGYITREWYPYFLSARRGGRGFDDFYADGLISVYSKQIMGALSEHRSLPVHELKSLAGFDKDGGARFEKALIDLQMGLFITVCGRAQKRNRHGEEYGWHSMTYCKTENFWTQDVFDKASEIDKDEAIETITGRVYELNKAADKRRVKKFITG